MAWSWSHTAEAYANAEANLRDLPLDDLRVIQAEWDTRSSLASDDDFSQWRYAQALAAIKRQDLPADVLADDIWDKASEQRTCDNGGYNAWMCPYGCHTVSFDREEQ